MQGKRAAYRYYQGLILLTLAAPGSVLAQTVPAADEADAKEIIVTGTRRVDRTATESSVPVDVLTAEALKAQPSGDMNEILKNLIPSLNVGRNSIRDGSAFIRQPNLRGLAPDETLVLINGKRFHKSALVSLNANSLFAASQGVDLNQIPVAAIGRIDVLRDGAAAQYGSDAIAGVINYTLKNNSKGVELDARVGKYGAGDGEELQIAGNIGFPLGDGFINLTADYITSAETVRGTQRPNAVVLESRGYNVEKPTQKYGNPNVEAFHLFANAAVPLSDDVELYAFGNYGRSDQSSSFFFRTPVDVTVPVPAGSGLQATFGKSIATTYLDTITAIDPRTTSPTFGMPTTFFDFNGRKFETSDIYPNGFTPILHGKLVDYSGVGGIRGQIGGVNYDASASYGRNSIAYVLDRTVNPSLGPNTSLSHYIGQLVQQEWNYNLDFSYALEVGLASPVNIAVGGEHRRENYQIRQGANDSWMSGPYAVQEVYNATTNSVSLVTHGVGANGLPGYGPDSVSNASRHSYAAYIDVEADITEKFTLGIAGRYEDFSDFGNTTIGKVSGRYAFTPAIALRGAASTGFKAPTPGQLFTRNVSTAFEVGTGVPYELALLRSTDAAATYYGAVPLKPEKSTNFSGGVVFTPSSKLTLTVDYFNIEVKDRIGVTGQFAVRPVDRTALRDLGVANWATIGRVRYMTNGFSTRTQGVDVVGTHTLSTDIGSFTTQLAGNWTQTKVIDRRNTVGPGNQSFALIDDVGKGNIENLIPKARGTLTETWSSDPWTVVGRMRYYGSYTHFTTINSIITPQKFGSEFLFDLGVSHTITEHATLTIGAENIFDNYPDLEKRGIYPITNSTANGSLYLDDAPTGFNGAFIYARLGVKF
ncbi:MAG: TonB-dependent receptor [Sphingobium sp.]